MLNISKNSLHDKIDLTTYKSGEKIFRLKHYTYLNRFLSAFGILVLIMLFLPWTQNITGSGLVTSLTPDQRPQTIQSQIPGRIEKWYVREGDYVQKGDTIMRISEVKSEYFDNRLIELTSEQINAKSMSVKAYQEKVGQLDRQIEALTLERKLKLEMAQNKLMQAKLKVENDSINLEAAKTNLQIAQRQYDREVTLQKEGISALKNVEAKKLKLQETQAKLVNSENKLLASKNEVLNARININSTKTSYDEKISKATSDMFTAKSNAFSSSAEVSKLENTNNNYKVRNSLLYVTAPQSGFIFKSAKGGIGVTFKEGEDLVGIMPANLDLAVETYVRPIDLPLIHIGEKVRIQFDGWPAIVFSGWPNVSYGTYGAKVVAVERFISANGMYRVLLAPDEEDHEWPEEIRVGSGARTIALLEDVPIWFELWRQLNSFPPNYYQPQDKMGKKDASKEKK